MPTAAPAAATAPARPMLPSTDYPDLPESLTATHRPYSSGIHLWQPYGEGHTGFFEVPIPAEENFASWSPAMQEPHVAKAVLMAMLGVRSNLVGTHIAPDAPVPAGRSYPRVDFVFSEDIDDSQASYAEQLLDLAADRALLYRFGKELSSSFRAGLINMAFGAGLVGICYELGEVSCEVWREVDGPGSTPPLAIARTKLLPFRAVFHLLTEIVDRHEGKTGITVIRLLEGFRQELIGNPQGTLAIEALLQQACRPFFAMLSAWIYEGKQRGEELSIRNTGNTDFMRWELPPTSLPLFLRDFAQKVLQCGQLVLMLERSNTPYSPTRHELRYDPAPGYYQPVIDLAHQEANAAVLSLLRQEHRLVARLKFYHQFLLVGHSTWFKSLMDYCNANTVCNVERKMNEARWEEIQRLGSTAIRAECARLGHPDQWCDNLSIGPAEKSLIKIVKQMAQMERDDGRRPDAGRSAAAIMDVLTALKLDCECAWPLNIVLDWGDSVRKYQFLGRLVMRIKGLLHMLHGHRLPRQGARRPRDGRQRNSAEVKAQRDFCTLRARMIGFLKSLEMYIMFEVIEPAFAAMINKVLGATTVEEIRAAHNTFLSDCLAAAMATSEGLYKKLELTFLSCKLFAEVAKRIDEPSAAYGGGDPSRQYSDIVERFDVQFAERLSDLLQDMQASQTGKGNRASEDHKYLRNILNRLDFNKFYLSKEYYKE